MAIAAGTTYSSVIRVENVTFNNGGGNSQSSWDMTSVLANPTNANAGTNTNALFSARNDAVDGGWAGSIGYVDTPGGTLNTDSGPFSLMASGLFTISTNNGGTAANIEIALVQSETTGQFYLVCERGSGGGTGFGFTNANPGPAVFTLNAFDNGSFVLGDNNATAPCFLAGTRLLTRSGYRAVEELQVGDEVQTLNNGWQAIRWLGHRVEGKLANGTFPFKSQPIRIASHAFGPELPARDLWVSPDHAVFFRNHLIPAKHLVNGENIIRDADLESITYYHVLLDKHAVIFSEGLPTESYVPQENLGSFDNVDTCPEALRNDIVAPIGLYADCYPRASQGGIVETARAYLARNLADAVKLAAA